MSTPSPNPHMDADCSICLDPLQDGTEVKELICEHIFHAACEIKIVVERLTAGSGANRIYIYHKRCPLCRNAYQINVVPCPVPPVEATFTIATQTIPPTPTIALPLPAPRAAVLQAPTIALPPPRAAVLQAPTIALPPPSALPAFYIDLYDSLLRIQAPHAAAPMPPQMQMFPLPEHIAAVEIMRRGMTDAVDPLPEEVIEGYLSMYYRSLINRASLLPHFMFY